jgi:hypothetical protein
MHLDVEPSREDLNSVQEVLEAKSVEVFAFDQVAEPDAGWITSPCLVVKTDRSRFLVRGDIVSFGQRVELLKLSIDRTSDEDALASSSTSRESLLKFEIRTRKAKCYLLFGRELISPDRIIWPSVDVVACVFNGIVIEIGDRLLCIRYAPSPGLVSVALDQEIARHHLASAERIQVVVL